MSINIQCVYGDESVDHLNNCLIPNLKHATSKHINFYGMNYQPNGRQINQGRYHNVEVIDIKNCNKGKTGFAENHNKLFLESEKTEVFILINPDCIPLPNSIDCLLSSKKSDDIAIVEGRQWPYEHWKVYDQTTKETPWASGAFQLIDTNFYSNVKGMDPLYFLYCEDVDLSWRAWLNGYKVIYEPAAQIIHYTNGSFVRPDLISNEQYYSLRNFLLLSRKFFGDKKEKWAVELIKNKAPMQVRDRIFEDYYNNVRDNVDMRYSNSTHKYINIYGIGHYAKSMR